MSYDDEPKTVFKVQLTRRTREYWSLIKFFALLAGIFLSIGSCQLVVCHYATPKKDAMECLMPARQKLRGK